MAGPRWVRLDVDYFSNPKIAGLPAAAKLLHLAAICWSGSQLTDGEIPARVMPQLLQQSGATRRHITELCIRHLMYEVDGDYVLHDFTAMQESRETVQRKMRLRAERQARWRQRHDNEDDP